MFPFCVATRLMPLLCVAPSCARPFFGRDPRLLGWAGSLLKRNRLPGASVPLARTHPLLFSRFLSLPTFICRASLSGGRG
jgi:hypothetical protein